jgi:hypothetical protein
MMPSTNLLEMNCKELGHDFFFWFQFGRKVLWGNNDISANGSSNSSTKEVSLHIVPFVTWHSKWISQKLTQVECITTFFDPFCNKELTIVVKFRSLSSWALHKWISKNEALANHLIFRFFSTSFASNNKYQGYKTSSTTSIYNLDQHLNYNLDEVQAFNNVN